jgi:hypothetical protein
MSRKEKQPWNPFPLAVLSAGEKFDLTPAAISVLIYLGARSNWKGETCVGHTRMCADLRRSKDFVTTALKELYDKSVVKADGRVRHKGQADWRVISQSVLPSRNTAERDQSCLAGISGQSNPDQQDYVSPEEQDYDIPAYQSQTLQIKKEPNLADHSPLNLAEENNNNQPVVVVPPSNSNGKQDGLVSGYTPEEIANHAEACKLNPWVHANDSPNARRRPPFVAHLMTIDPPRKPIASKPTNPAFANTAGTDWAAHKKKVEEDEK